MTWYASKLRWFLKVYILIYLKTTQDRHLESLESFDKKESLSVYYTTLLFYDNEKSDQRWIENHKDYGMKVQTFNLSKFPLPERDLVLSMANIRPETDKFRCCTDLDQSSNISWVFNFNLKLSPSALSAWPSIWFSQPLPKKINEISKQIQESYTRL